MSSFNGMLEGITIHGIPLSILHPGKVIWLNNSSALAKGAIAGSDNNPGTFTRPVATLTEALSLVTASRGDVIAVMPGHSENVTGAATMDVNKAGVAIVGLGTGTKRPKFISTATDSTYVISAANVSHYNIEFQAAEADVVIGLDVSGVDGLSFDSCYFKDQSAILNYLDVIDIATGADDMYFTRCKFLTAATTNLSHITGVAGSGLYIEDCYFGQDGVQGTVTGQLEYSGDVTNVWIRDSVFRNFVDGALLVDLNGTANLGGMTNCYLSSNDAADATTAGVDFTGGHCFEVYVAGDADSYGIAGGGGAIYNNA